MNAMTIVGLEAGAHVVDESGQIWTISSTCETVVLERRFRGVTEKKFVRSCKDKIRKATPAEWEHYVDTDSAWGEAR